MKWEDARGSVNREVSDGEEDSHYHKGKEEVGLTREVGVVVIQIRADPGIENN